MQNDDTPAVPPHQPPSRTKGPRRARLTAYAVTLAVGALIGFTPGFQIASLLTGGSLGPRGATATITVGMLITLILFRPWGEFGNDRG